MFEVIKMSLSMFLKLLFLWFHSFGIHVPVWFLLFAMIYVCMYMSLAKHENNDGNENAVEGEMHGFLVLFIHWLFPFILFMRVCICAALALMRVK